MNDSNPLQTTQPGVCLKIFDIGVWIQGESGIGKSELALALLQRGHQLVADDAIDFTRQADEVIASCPSLLQDFLEVRGLGILNIRRLLSDAALTEQTVLKLVLSLQQHTAVEKINQDRLNEQHTEVQLLKQHYPVIILPVITGRNLENLAEMAVKNFLLQQSGYNANADFIARQKQLLSQTDSST